MTDQETVAVIAAVEDIMIRTLPESVPLVRRIELVNSCRREVARVLRNTEPS